MSHALRASYFPIGCPRDLQRRLIPVAGSCVLLFGCGGTEPAMTSVGGTGALAGQGSSGGMSGNASPRGTRASGGTGSFAGGASSSGGTDAGGALSSGGAGSSAGGTAALGGSAVLGGSAALGGALSTGGAFTTGGRLATGGSASGGSASGGSRQTGGSRATAIGGSSTGGAAPGTGGRSAATGGSQSTSSGGGATVGGSANGGSASVGGSTDGGATGTDRCGQPAVVSIPSGYTKLAWHDEFEIDGAPNSANWGYENGFVRNNELQWYQSKNASVSDGLLHVTARRERATNPNYDPNGSDWKTTRQYAEYTSASLTTSGKQTWKFGRFVFCGKIPISNGMWPAWWALGVSGEWPSNGEIDMMEFYKGKILANVAVGTSTRWTARWFSATKAVDAAWAANYHLWRMDWDTNSIKLYVDDALLNSVSLTDAVNADGATPFRQNAYMMVNLAIGGDNGGDPSGTVFPQELLVDYVRVFQ